MSLWGRLFALGYDCILARSERAGMRERRRNLLSEGHGSVLEIGAGTGLNLPLYPDGVQRLVLAEPEEPMARRLERRLARVGRPAEVVRAPAEDLPFDDGSFDFAVSTLVLCTVPDPARALAEVRRVLKPGGRLLFLEHVRSEEPRLARWQDRLHPLQVRFGHGCHCNRPTLANIVAAAFDVRSVEHGTIPAVPPIVRPLIVGSAQPSSA